MSNFNFDDAGAIDIVVSKCHNQAKNSGWWNNEREIGTLLMLCVSELSEAMEGDRKNLQDNHLPKRKMFDVELADTVIRIFDIAGKRRIPLGDIIKEKLDYNRNRADHKIENRAKDNGKRY